MPIQSKIFSAQGYVIHSVSESVLLQDIYAVWAPLLMDSEFHPELNVVWQFLPGAVLDIAAEDMHEMVRKVAAHIQTKGCSYRLALVCTDDLNFGVSRMFEGLSTRLPLSVAVFRQLDDALEWVTVKA